MYEFSFHYLPHFLNIFHVTFKELIGQLDGFIKRFDELYEKDWKNLKWKELSEIYLFEDWDQKTHMHWNYGQISENMLQFILRITYFFVKISITVPIQKQRLICCPVRREL